VGDFTRWQKHPIKLHKENGVWRMTVKLGATNGERRDDSTAKQTVSNPFRGQDESGECSGTLKGSGMLQYLRSETHRACERTFTNMNSSKLSGDSRRKTTARQTRLRIQDILATTDLSNESIAGVRYAAALAKKVGAVVALLHVVEFPTPPPMPGMRSVTLSLQDSKIGKYARGRLKTLAKRESKGDVNLTPILLGGNSFYGIITAARDRAVDLIVIATHGYTGAKRVLLGSTTERVVRHAPCPVLTVPARITRRRACKMPPLNLKRILVPIDFSKTSKTAFPWAASIAVRSNAELILLHVVEKFPVDYLLGPELMNETITPLIKQSEAELKRMAEGLSKSTGLKVSGVVRAGKPFKEICSAAQ
jgi:nucleotide-binding universal stress UspA family protein